MVHELRAGERVLPVREEDGVHQCDLADQAQRGGHLPCHCPTMWSPSV